MPHLIPWMENRVIFVFCEGSLTCNARDAFSARLVASYARFCTDKGLISRLLMVHSSTFSPHLSCLFARTYIDRRCVSEFLNMRRKYTVSKDAAAPQSLR